LWARRTEQVCVYLSISQNSIFNTLFSGNNLMFLLLPRHNFSDFVKPASSKGKSIDDIHLTEDELGLYLDLAPFLNPSPYIVPEDMSLAKVNHALLLNYTSFSLR